MATGTARAKYLNTKTTIAYKKSEHLYRPIDISNTRQARLIVEIDADQLLVCTDADDAGRAAQEQWLRTLFAAGGRPRSLILPNGHDPASWITSGVTRDQRQPRISSVIIL